MPPDPPFDSHAAALDELVSMGMDLARAIYVDAMNASAPQSEQVAGFERVSRTVRRTILLARRLGEMPTGRTRRVAARARVIREVEDAIGCEHGDGEHAERLRAELCERLDMPELDEALALRPVAEVVAELRHDLGLDGGLDDRPDGGPGDAPVPNGRWRRRTPAAAREVQRRAGSFPAGPVRRSAWSLLVPEGGEGGAAPARADGRDSPDG